MRDCRAYHRNGGRPCSVVEGLLCICCCHLLYNSLVQAGQVDLFTENLPWKGVSLPDNRQEKMFYP